MDIKTKYDVGQKLFWLDMRDGIWKINHDQIKSINIGGRECDKYEIGYTTRPTSDLFTDFEEARKEASSRQKQTNLRALEIIQEYKPPINHPLT